MKKSILLILLACLFLYSCTSAQNDQTLTKSKLVGTWKVYKVNMDETYYLSIHPNNKVNAYGKDWDTWEYYTLKDKFFYYYKESNKNKWEEYMMITQFDGKNMKCTNAAGWHFEAEKVSEKPIKVPYDPKIENHKHMILRSVDCPYCHNTCRMNCMLCVGAGGTYEPDYSSERATTRYKPCWHCAGTGKSRCLHCDCGRH